MPCVRIATGPWIGGREGDMLEAVQTALVEAFKIPPTDRDVVLDVYEPHRRLVPGGRSDRFTRIEIIGIAARSMEAKRALYRILADKLEHLGVPRRETRFVLIEPMPENWGVTGGVPASEVNLGFKIDV